MDSIKVKENDKLLRKDKNMQTIIWFYLLYNTNAIVQLQLIIYNAYY